MKKDTLNKPVPVQVYDYKPQQLPLASQPQNSKDSNHTPNTPKPSQAPPSLQSPPPNTSCPTPTTVKNTNAIQPLVSQQYYSPQGQVVHQYAALGPSSNSQVGVTGGSYNQASSSYSYTGYQQTQQTATDSSAQYYYADSYSYQTSNVPAQQYQQTDPPAANPQQYYAQGSAYAQAPPSTADYSQTQAGAHYPQATPTSAQPVGSYAAYTQQQYAAPTAGQPATQQAWQGYVGYAGQEQQQQYYSTGYAQGQGQAPSQYGYQVPGQNTNTPASYNYGS